LSCFPIRKSTFFPSVVLVVFDDSFTKNNTFQPPIRYTFSIKSLQFGDPLLGAFFNYVLPLLAAWLLAWATGWLLAWLAGWLGDCWLGWLSG
jgi:hypothetical protein